MRTTLMEVFPSYPFIDDDDDEQHLYGAIYLF